MALSINYAVARQIAAQAQAAAPREACGLLAGTGQRISWALPVHTRAAAPQRQFRLDPNEQLQALKKIDAAGLTWLGVYHSHPASPPIPSRADIDAAQAEASLLHLIVSLERAKPRLKLWRIEGDSVQPLELVFDTQVPPPRPTPLSAGQQRQLIVIGLVGLCVLLLLSFWLLPPAPILGPAS